LHINALAVIALASKAIIQVAVVFRPTRHKVNRCWLQMTMYGRVLAACYTMIMLMTTQRGPFLYSISFIAQQCQGYGGIFGDSAGRVDRGVLLYTHETFMKQNIKGLYYV
jgi:hypothetical protein